MKKIIPLLLLLSGCAEFTAVEMPDDPHRACELECTTRLVEAERQRDPDYATAFISCRICNVPKPELISI